MLSWPILVVGGLAVLLVGFIRVFRRELAFNVERTARLERRLNFLKEEYRQVSDRYERLKETRQTALK